MEKKPPRKKTASDIETAVLAKSARRCALCFHLNGDLMEKHGQIAHLDEDRTNGAEDNLAFLCLNHHSLYDSKTRQHKNYTMHEVKSARSRLYDLVTEGTYLTPATAKPYLESEADKRILRDFLDIVPSNGSIKFLKSHDFGFSFESERLEDIDRFVHDRDGPEHEFLDPELEMARRTFRESCLSMTRALTGNSFTTNREGWEGIPSEWEEENPKRFNNARDELNKAADNLCDSYEQFVRTVRKKLAVRR